MTLSNNKLAEQFAEGKQSGSSAHASIVGDLFYSYSTIIAQRYIYDKNAEYKVMLIDFKTISQTTSRHISAVSYNARLARWVIINCSKAREDMLVSQLEKNSTDYDYAVQKSLRTRTPFMNKYWIEKADDLEEQNRLIKEILDAKEIQWRHLYGNANLSI